MSRSICATVLLALVVTACRLAGGTAPSSSSTPSATAESAETPTPSGAISEEEAINIASDLRHDPETTELDSAVSGAFGDVGPSDVGEQISSDQQVWAVTFVGEYNEACDYSDCPDPGTETVFIDYWTGDFLMSQIRTEGG